MVGDLEEVENEDEIESLEEEMQGDFDELDDAEEQGSKYSKKRDKKQDAKKKPKF